jgi:hypothetical protein
MKIIFQIIALFAFVIGLRADVATSANYAITSATTSGGGGRSSAGPYVQDVLISPIAGREIAQLSVAGILGFIGILNNPPVAVDDIRSRPPDAAVDLLSAALLANDFDPDGDTLSILSVQDTSARGGKVTLVSGSVHYVPPAGFDGVDQFAYTALDSGGDTAVGIVTLSVAPPVSDQPINSIAFIRQSNGTILLRFRQQPGWNEYVIERTEDLANPNWQLVSDTHSGADGIVEIVIDPSQSQQGYYRASVL